MYPKVEKVPEAFCERYCAAWKTKTKTCGRLYNPYAKGFCMWTKNEIRKGLIELKRKGGKR